MKMHWYIVFVWLGCSSLLYPVEQMLSKPVTNSLSTHTPSAYPQFLDLSASPVYSKVIGKNSSQSVMHTFSSENIGEKEEEEHHHHEGKETSEDKNNEGFLLDPYSACKYAVIHDDVVSVNHLMQDGFSINSVDEQTGENFLHIAAWYGSGHVLLLLLHAGVDLNAQDKQGNTPLHNAVKNNQLYVVQMLLQFGALRNIKNNHGLYAYDYSRDKAMNSLFPQSINKQIPLTFASIRNAS